MKTIIFLLSLFATQLFAASITVRPFEMEFDLQVGYSVKGEVELSCRYEEWVWGDSAQYETFYQDPSPVMISEEKMGDKKRVTIKNPRELYFEYDEFFRSNEECRASFKFVFYSENYAMGFGANPKKPVSFKLWKGFYDYQDGDRVYDLNKMRKYLDKTEYTFVEKRFQDSHINIWIKQDGREADTSPWVAKAYIDPTTNLPYPPQL